MSDSILLSLARQSIEEVLEAKRLIDIPALSAQYPTLDTHYACFINIYVDAQLRNSYGSLHAHKSLIEDIIYNAKFAAFEDPNSTPLSTSQYLHASIEVSILSDLIEIPYLGLLQLSKNIVSGVDGLTVIYKERAATLIPQRWSEVGSKEEFISLLLKNFDLELSQINSEMKFYKYSVESAKDTPILNA